MRRFNDMESRPNPPWLLQEEIRPSHKRRIRRNRLGVIVKEPCGASNGWWIYQPVASMALRISSLRARNRLTSPEASATRIFFPDTDSEKAIQYSSS